MRRDRETGGASFSVSIVIAVPPAAVFAYLADPRTAPVIDPAVASYEPEGGNMGLGVRNRIKMRMLGIPIVLVSETIGWERDTMMAFRSIKPGRPAVGVATHRFERHPSGTTYTWSMDFVPTGLGGRLMARVAARLFARNARKQQQRLRSVLERR